MKQCMFVKIDYFHLIERECVVVDAVLIVWWLLHHLKMKICSPEKNRNLKIVPTFSDWNAIQVCSSRQYHHHQHLLNVDQELYCRIGVFSMPSISASLQWPQLASAIWLQAYQEQVIMSNDYVLYVKQCKVNLINWQAFDIRMSSFKL